MNKPFRTTAEIPLIMGAPDITNNMKSSCMGGFSFEVERICSACYFDEPDKDCEVCEREIHYLETIVVPWTTCKEIYKKMAQVAIRDQAFRDQAFRELTKQAQDLKLGYE